MEAAAWLAGQAERTIETAMARVFLVGDLAFKQKKTVSFSYGNLSTPERRHWALERELAFNQPAAPALYRGLRRVTRRAGGGLEVDGPGDLVDLVLEMRRFPDGAVLANDPAALDGEAAEALGRTIAELHGRAPPRRGTGLELTIPSNAQILGELAPQLGARETAALVAETQAEYERRRPHLEARADAGFSRRCHGDLHLGNILLEDGRATPFDCIEFNDALSDIDVLYDLAFLLMDLGFRDRRDAAVRVLGGYLDQAARHFDDGVWDGLIALPLFQSVRATVRAHVSAHSGDLALARRYVAAAREHLRPRPARLVAVGGRSGSGKSSVARALAPALGAAPGAVILRSDEARKRLAGVGSTEAAGRETYTPDIDARVFAALFDGAGRLLRAGHSVVLDATFLDPALRARAEALAKAAGVRFDGVWLEASLETLAGRVAARRGDASEATLEVLQAQMRRDPGELSWTRLDAAGRAEATARRWLDAFA